MEGKRNKDDEAEIRKAFDDAFPMSEDERERFSFDIEDLQDRLREMRDDNLWPPLPTKLTETGNDKSFFPTSKRIQAQIKRHAAKLGEDAAIVEYLRLQNLRSFQSTFGELYEFLTEADRANGTTLVTAFVTAVVQAFGLGQAYPPEEVGKKARVTTALGSPIINIIKKLVQENPKSRRGTIVKEARAEMRRLGITEPDKDAGLLSLISDERKNIRR
jgi:hypothetical protein